ATAAAARAGVRPRLAGPAGQTAGPAARHDLPAAHRPDRGAASAPPAGVKREPAGAGAGDGGAAGRLPPAVGAPGAPGPVRRVAGRRGGVWDQRVVRRSVGAGGAAVGESGLVFWRASSREADVEMHVALTLRRSPEIKHALARPLRLDGEVGGVRAA